MKVAPALDAVWVFLVRSDIRSLFGNAGLIVIEVVGNPFGHVPQGVNEAKGVAGAGTSEKVVSQLSRRVYTKVRPALLRRGRIEMSAELLPGIPSGD